MASNMGTHCSGRSRAARVGRLLVAGGLLAVLIACGTQFVYNRLDWLTHYYLSSQVSLDGSQSRELRRGLESFFAWHRRNELPRYAAFLDRMANDTARPVSFAQLEAGRHQVETFTRDAVSHGAPEAARWFNGLRPEQVDELFASLAEGDRKARKENCESDPAERREKAVERFTDNVEDWTGRLCACAARADRERDSQPSRAMPAPRSRRASARASSSARWSINTVSGRSSRSASPHFSRIPKSAGTPRTGAMSKPIARGSCACWRTSTRA